MGTQENLDIHVPNLRNCCHTYDFHLASHNRRHTYPHYIVHGIKLCPCYYFLDLIPDCVEFGQVESGRRSEAGVYGTVLITQKMTGGIVGLTIGFVLAALGFTHDIETSATITNDLNKFIAIFPTLLILASIIPIILPSMNRSKHKLVIGQLE